jgi:hypothetical protein
MKKKSFLNVYNFGLWCLGCTETNFQPHVGSVRFSLLSFLATDDEEMERNLSQWQRMDVLYECDGMNVLYVFTILK